MSISLVLVPYADTINKVGHKKKGFFPRSSSRRSLSVMDLVTEMEEGNITRAIADKALKDGSLVKVDGYGFFKPVLTIREGADKTDLKEKDIKFDKVEFTLTAAGKEKLKDTQFVIKPKGI